MIYTINLEHYKLYGSQYLLMIEEYLMMDIQPTIPEGEHLKIRIINIPDREPLEMGIDPAKFYNGVKLVIDAVSQFNPKHI